MFNVHPVFVWWFSAKFKNRQSPNAILTTSEFSMKLAISRFGYPTLPVMWVIGVISPFFLNSLLEAFVYNYFCFQKPKKLVRQEISCFLPQLFLCPHGHAFIHFCHSVKRWLILTKSIQVLNICSWYSNCMPDANCVCLSVQELMYKSGFVFISSYYVFKFDKP